MRIISRERHTAASPPTWPIARPQRPRFWNRARSSYELYKNMYKSLDQDEFNKLSFAYDFKQAEFNTSMTQIRDKTSFSRLLELTQPNMHSCELVPKPGCKGPVESCTTEKCTGN